MDLNREELAWAAGFYDGEGCLFFNRINRSVGIDVSQTSTTGEPPGTLTRFQNAVGGIGKIYGPYNKHDNGKPVYSFRVGKFERVQAIIAMLWLFLGQVKRDQAKDALVKLAEHRRNLTYGRLILT